MSNNENRKVLSCQFNIDIACVEVKLSNGSMLSIDCMAVEDVLEVNQFQLSELDYLIYNDPAAYADLILSGEPEVYLKAVTEHKPMDCGCRQPLFSLYHATFKSRNI